jgi:hypothetical protein
MGKKSWCYHQLTWPDKPVFITARIK